MSIPQNDKRRCYNCKFYYRHDRGYSNYTVEETEVNCLKRKHPHLNDSSEGYDWETDDHEWMKFAEQCDGFSRGEPLSIDCDEEESYGKDKTGKNLASFYTNDPEVIAAFEEFDKPPPHLKDREMTPYAP